VPEPDRAHDVTGLTAGELERARRDLQVSLALSTPGSPVSGPILARLSAIDTELAERSAGPRVTCWADEQLASLREDYAGCYDAWYVRCYPNHYRWCARPAGTQCATVNADSPEELAEVLARLTCHTRASIRQGGPAT
jgi:hypothetical protein